jgi:hypothetical protein
VDRADLQKQRVPRFFRARSCALSPGALPGVVRREVRESRDAALAAVQERHARQTRPRSRSAARGAALAAGDAQQYAGAGAEL